MRVPQAGTKAGALAEPAPARAQVEVVRGTVEAAQMVPLVNMYLGMGG